MKKTLSLLLILLVVCTAASAQTRKWEIYELNAAADLVLRGKISALTGSTYTFEISNVVAGAYSEKDITIQRFKDTKTVKRWGKYVVGEEMLVFIKKEGDLYHVLGDNGEGEKFIYGVEIYLDGRGGALKNTYGYHAVNAKLNIYSEKAMVAEFVTAIKDTKSCLTIELFEKERNTGEILKDRFYIKNCDDKTLDELRSRSWIHDLFFTTAEKHFKPN
jgi:hypothetical protein